MKDLSEYVDVFETHRDGSKALWTEVCEVQGVPTLCLCDYNECCPVEPSDLPRLVDDWRNNV